MMHAENAAMDEDPEKRSRRNKERDKAYGKKYRRIETHKLKDITTSISKAYRTWNKFKNDNSITAYNPRYDKKILPEPGNRYNATQKWAWALTKRIHTEYRKTKSEAQKAKYDATESGEWDVTKPTIQRTVYNIILSELNQYQCKMLLNITGWI